MEYCKLNQNVNNATEWYIDGLVQDYGNFITKALESP